MDELVLNWTRELEWENNPFKKDTLDPAFIGGYEKEREKLNLFLLNESSFGTITGLDGMGKTMLLHWFISQLDKHPEKFTYTFLKKEDLADERFLHAICTPFYKKNKLKDGFRKIFKKEEKITRKNVSSYITKNMTGKHFLIIIDDSHLLSKEDLEVLEAVHQIPHLQVILSGKSSEKLKGFEKDSIGIDLRKMDFASGREMLKKRIEQVGGTDIWPFTDKILKDMFGLADYMPKKILTLCAERAKELAIDVKRGKIKRPDHRFIKFEHEDHNYSYEEHAVEHQTVEKKHKNDGFVVKFTFKDDEETAPKTEHEEMAAPPKKEEQENKEAKEEKTEPKKTEKKTQETKEDKKDDGIIDIDLGYEEKPKKETKPRKMEAFDIDIRPKKKK